MILKEQQLLNITGGSVSAALVSAIANTASKILNLGQIVGSAIRRIITKCHC